MRSTIVSIVFLLAAACGAGVQSEPKQIGGPGQAECSAADGPLHDYSTPAELNQLIVGTWVHCSGPAVMGGGDGIELVADGTYHVLLDDGQGGLVRETGFDGQGTWVGITITPTSVEFAWDNAAHTGDEGYVTFEDQPRKFLLALQEPSIYALLP
jgi:hypothetical protein